MAPPARLCCWLCPCLASCRSGCTSCRVWCLPVAECCKSAASVTPGWPCETANLLGGSRRGLHCRAASCKVNKAAAVQQHNTVRHTSCGQHSVVDAEVVRKQQHVDLCRVVVQVPTVIISDKALASNVAPAQPTDTECVESQCSTTSRCSCSLPMPINTSRVCSATELCDIFTLASSLTLT